MMQVGMRVLAAARQLEVQRAYPALIPGLVRQGLEPEDAAALAHNIVFLFHVLELEPAPQKPQELLERFSMAQIAWLCKEYAARRAKLEQLEVTVAGEEEQDGVSTGPAEQPPGL